MNSPLADRIRPKKIEDVAGQHHLLDEGKVLRRIIDSGNIPNLIFALFVLIIPVAKITVIIIRNAVFNTCCRRARNTRQFLMQTAALRQNRKIKLLGNYHICSFGNYKKGKLAAFCRCSADCTRFPVERKSCRKR